MLSPNSKITSRSTHHASNQTPVLAASIVKHETIGRAFMIQQCSPGKKCQCPSLLDCTLENLQRICHRILWRENGSSARKELKNETLGCCCTGIGCSDVPDTLRSKLDRRLKCITYVNIMCVHIYISIRLNQNICFA